LFGHVGDQDVLLVRSGPEIFAIDAHCSHYHGPLAEGLVVGDSIRRPWQHACFDPRSGEATRSPALNALVVRQVEHEGDRIFVTSARRRAAPSCDQRGRKRDPRKLVTISTGQYFGFTRAARFAQSLGYRGLQSCVDLGPLGWMNGWPDDGTLRYNRSAVREIATSLSS
jgi:nitrite reductase/ring-hydroxylating ferredoxin subunit